ncbi:MAG: RecX family transcriptional regulator [Geminicoccaceae bacterium]|jgi:regulatory protein|nr:RecX family transcriptional regulator [Geminicoccaceae bacterium]HRY23087.1 RecX family transcriptional regulator [Geminicoccaceae bacterium]
MAPGRLGRPAKRPTPERLRRRALAYLERFSTSRAHLGTVLRRRALREAETLELEAAPVEAAIEALLDDLVRLGLVDDRAFAETRARRLVEKGRPARRIVQELAAKGVDRNVAMGVLEGLGEETPDLDLAAALAFARRRRLGPWAVPGGRERTPEQALAAFARAGFPYAVARQVLEAASLDELEAEVRDA